MIKEDELITLSDFLQATASIRAISIADGHFDALVITYCEEILKLALSPDGGNPGIKAFTLLTKPSPITSDCLLQKNLFFRYMSQILQKYNDYPSFVIGRLAAIFLNIILSESDGKKEAIGFLVNFLNFTDNSGVLDMFSKILCFNAGGEWLYQILIYTNFSRFVLDEFKKTPMSNEKLAAMLELLNLCIGNWALRDNFSNDAFISVLETNLSNSDLYVTNNLWVAIASICSEKTVEGMKNIFQVGIKIITQPQIKQHHLYHAGILDFMSKVIVLKKEETFFEINTINPLIKAVSRMMVAFPGATFLQNSIFKFVVKNGLKCYKFKEAIVKIFCPIAITMSMADKRSAASANCAAFVMTFEELRISDKTFDGFCKESLTYEECKTNFIKDYQKKITQKYGGKIKTDIPDKAAGKSLKAKILPTDIPINKIVV